MAQSIINSASLIRGRTPLKKTIDLQSICQLNYPHRYVLMKSCNEPLLRLLHYTNAANLATNSATWLLPSMKTLRYFYNRCHNLQRG